MSLEDVEGRGLLISIRPKYADAILNGHKTVELRRTRPALGSGSVVLIYASSPDMALVGSAVVADIVTHHPLDLWVQHNQTLGVSYREFSDYFAGTDTAHGLVLQRARRLARISLTGLREIGLSPPQSWRYVGHETIKLIHSANEWQVRSVPAESAERRSLAGCGPNCSSGLACATERVHANRPRPLDAGS